MIKIIFAMILTCFASVIGLNLAAILNGNDFTRMLFALTFAIAAVCGFVLHELQSIKKILNPQNEKDSDLQNSEIKKDDNEK